MIEWMVILGDDAHGQSQMLGDRPEKRVPSLSVQNAAACLRHTQFGRGPLSRSCGVKRFLRKL